MSIVRWVLVMILPGVCWTKSFGVVGETFPVLEMSLLKLIELRLNELEVQGELTALKVRWVNEVANHVNRPKPVPLSRALQTRTHQFKPEVVLTKDLLDEEGQVLFKAGLKVNALEHLPHYQPCWLFFNADDKAEVLWAKKVLTTCNNPKLILTKGSIADAERVFQRTIYFDQEGRISKKIGLTSIPAKVTRADNAMLIRQVCIKESGDEL